MLRQIVARIRRAGESIGKSRAVVDVGGDVGAPGQGDIAARIECVALIVVKRAEAGRERKVSETAGDGAAAFGNLVGVSEVQLAAVGKSRRTKRQLPAANHGLRDGDRKEDAGSADVVVIEKIAGVGLEVIGVKNPSPKRDGDAELMLFVAFAVERGKSQALLAGVIDQRRAGDGLNWWCLIVVPIESAEGPTQLGDGDGGAEARLDGRLFHRWCGRSHGEISSRRSAWDACPRKG